MKWLILLSIFIDGVWSQSTDCNLGTGAGCSTSGPYSYTSTGLNNAYYPTCRRSYRVVITLPPGQQGITCNFWTKCPSGRIYSISHSPTTIGNIGTPVIRTFTKNVWIQPQSVVSPNEDRFNFMSHRDLHGENYNYVSYRIHNRRLRMFSAFTGDSFTMGHSAFFTPTSRRLYIGLNRWYPGSTTANQGFGVCRFQCTMTSSQFSSRESGQSSAANALTEL